MECNHEVKELIIVGGGPAGITAAIYAARMKRCVWMFYETLAGQATLTGSIRNYPGFAMTSGLDFAAKLGDHLNDYDLQPRAEKVLEVSKAGGLFEVRTAKGLYRSKAVIIASGARHRTLGVPGEREYTGRGVAYCAICDAPFYKDKDVSVVGGGNSALTTALELEKYASKVYLVTLNDTMTGEQTLIDLVKSSPKIELLARSRAKGISGDGSVKALDVETQGAARRIAVQGVFVEVGYEANSGIIDAGKNDRGEIMVDEANRTSVEGAFAAGDVTDTRVKQIIVAAGEGAKAALSASEYLTRAAGRV
jgi:thioredoxin-disulfide reductase